MDASTVTTVTRWRPLHVMRLAVGDSALCGGVAAILQHGDAGEVCCTTRGSASNGIATSASSTSAIAIAIATILAASGVRDQPHQLRRERLPHERALECRVQPALRRLLLLHDERRAVHHLVAVLVVLPQAWQPTSHRAEPLVAARTVGGV